LLLRLVCVILKPGGAVMTITKRWVEAWAAKYPADSDVTIEKLAGRRRPTFRDVEAIVRWKSRRSLGYFRRNDPAEVATTVRQALGAP
jgi:hypothetical protein